MCDCFNGNVASVWLQVANVHHGKRRCTCGVFFANLEAVLALRSKPFQAHDGYIAKYARVGDWTNNSKWPDLLCRLGSCSRVCIRPPSGRSGKQELEHRWLLSQEPGEQGPENPCALLPSLRLGESSSAVTGDGEALSCPPKPRSACNQPSQRIGSRSDFLLP